MVREPVYITGPTGCGKSALAVEAAMALGGEIINADAFQVYQGMEILTAQPSLEDKERVPHHLYGFLPAFEEFDAARFGALAKLKIAEVQRRGNLPIVVGGSGLYIKGLTHGLADLPQVDLELRAKLADSSLEELLPQLLKLDPEAETHVNLRNPRHVQRALEICLLTGKPASSFKQAWKEERELPRGVFLNLDRKELYARINQRTHAMFSGGVVDEVKQLTENSGIEGQDVPPLCGFSKTAGKAIGLREIVSGMESASMIEAIQQATRRYAKRQITWFKRETYFTPVSTAAEALQQILKLVATPTP